jgi:hypothetical protein
VYKTCPEILSKEEIIIIITLFKATKTCKPVYSNMALNLSKLRQNKKY